MLHPKRKNEAQREAPPLTPRSQRLETLQKQRIYSAQRSTPRCAERSIVYSQEKPHSARAALHSAQRDESRKKMPYMYHATI